MSSNIVKGILSRSNKASQTIEICMNNENTEVFDSGIIL